MADVSYNLLENTFSINPLTGSMPVAIQKGDLQQTLTISETTSFVFEGEEIIPEPIGEPADIKQYFIKENGVYVPIKKKLLKENISWVPIS